jgi:chromosome segregation ATPase
MEMLLRFFSWVVSFFKKKPEPLIAEDADLPEQPGVSKELASIAEPVDPKWEAELAKVRALFTEEEIRQGELEQGEKANQPSTLRDKLSDDETESLKKIMDLYDRRYELFTQEMQPLAMERDNIEKRIVLDLKYIKFHGTEENSVERLENLYDEHYQLIDRIDEYIKEYRQMSDEISKMEEEHKQRFGIAGELDAYYEHIEETEKKNNTPTLRKF